MNTKIWTLCLASLVLVTACQRHDKNLIVAQGVVDAPVLTIKSQVPGSIILSVADGQQVKAQETLARIDSRKIETQIEALNLDKRELSLNRDSLRTSISLITRQLGYLTRQDERFKRLVKAESLPAEKRESMELQKLQAETQLFDLQKKMEQLDLTEEKLSVRGQQLQLQLADHELKAPIDGLILETHTESGETVFPGGNVVDLMATDGFTIDIFLEENELSSIRIGTEANLILDGGGSPIKGVVKTISRNAEFSSKYIISEKERASLLFKVTLRLSADERLKVGQPATIEIVPAAS